MSRDIYAEVRPTGWLAGVLSRVGNPRKHRWNAYLRACRAIPKGSPVAGSTSFKKINARRCKLIPREILAHTARPFKRSAELEALQKAVGEWLCGPLVVSNFLSARLLRRLQRKN